ncbi:hypothetical protein SDRG_07655 [Saprolegnia diclina VS20]|uniref:G domain-containing protein n=1 Tax=Saprolegnia diclina (strain VS20) TaxID=1156394 RepID=T0RQI8_SAPDV|nr:hypothetical protein SDRG_07655 [Saprolegnia diclina VS20]EQC34853.1 hypothetical protein SDRG_07655 [Saprolegnia diclina VS20]|eukprot:XP_008611725.1 hypothetical protein SDRG_07655 [Saprolegnia diclina VS20]
MEEEQLMGRVADLYGGDQGLAAIGKDVGLGHDILTPRKKVTVMIIGNHSAGKSSFINWYVGEDIQRTGVAIETQGFTFITSGMKRTLAPIKGDSTLLLYPHLMPLSKEYGKSLVENLTTHVSTSTARHFKVVDFCDTPGLVDGDIAYPFDVNAAIVSMAAYADLIFVFLDPMGQALCSRTMNVVKALNANGQFADKMKYYLTKADTVTDSKEMMKLMVQITQNIKANIQNQHGLEIPSIWIQKPHMPTPPEHLAQLNQIDSVCDVIEQSIHQKVQDNLSQVERDCDRVRETIRGLLLKDELQRAAKRSRQLVATSFAVSAWVVPLVTFVLLVGEYKTSLPRAILEADVIMDVIENVHAAFRPLVLDPSAPLGLLSTLKLLGSSVVLFVLLNAVTQFVKTRARNFETQTRDTVARWTSYDRVLDDILASRLELFREYVSAYTAAQ